MFENVDIFSLETFFFGYFAIVEI